MAELASIIRELRIYCGFTQDFVAGKVGVSRVTLARWEHGERSPHQSNRGRLAEFFCITTAQLEGVAPIEPAEVRARWLQREYEQSIGGEADTGADTLAQFSDQAIILEAAKRFYKIVIELAELIDAAERMDWENAVVSIRDAVKHGKPFPEEKDCYLSVYELIGDLFAEINSRFSLYWTSRDQYEKMPRRPGDDAPLDYDELAGRHERLLERLEDERGAVYKCLSQRSVSRQRFARIEDLIAAARAAIGQAGE